MGSVLVELESILVVPGLIQFGGRTFKSTAFTTCNTGSKTHLHDLSFCHKIRFSCPHIFVS